MLPPAYRMRRSADFSTAVRAGVRAGRPRLVVHLTNGSSVDCSATPMAGFVVSKAVGGAVARNRVKRQLRHLVRSRLTRLPGGARLVVRALPPAAGATSAELGSDLDAALNRAVPRLDRRVERPTRSRS